ncbi:hypothetical protein PsYK624_053810 [Phanerochaete sordida]|uniref:Uncharacterized protein n=1 Tax=Phanerochaete sordida TaxID=48140 RepID=A0A9P3G8E1_9APHY|nr:hypothetical protein PsYK624_053810 [Phanerochaete sordida]
MSPAAARTLQPLLAALFCVAAPSPAPGILSEEQSELGDSPKPRTGVAQRSEGAAGRRVSGSRHETLRVEARNAPRCQVDGHDSAGAVENASCPRAVQRESDRWGLPGGTPGAFETHREVIAGVTVRSALLLSTVQGRLGPRALAHRQVRQQRCGRRLRQKSPPYLLRPTMGRPGPRELLTGRCETYTAGRVACVLQGPAAAGPAQRGPPPFARARAHSSSPPGRARPRPSHALRPLGLGHATLRASHAAAFLDAFAASSREPFLMPSRQPPCDPTPAPCSAARGPCACAGPGQAIAAPRACAPQARPSARRARASSAPPRAGRRARCAPSPPARTLRFAAWRDVGRGTSQD